MKIAIVTGATSGIGEATSRSLINAGYQVMLTGRRVDRLEALAQDLGERSAYHVTDVTSRQDMTALVEKTIQTFGEPNVLINNAGVMPLSFFASRKVDEWDQMIDVNLKGVLYGIDAVLPYMLGQEDGHIVNVASIAGLQAGPAFGAYSATKFGVRGLSESLRQEVGAKNIRVSVISPGTVQTELFGTITDENVLSVIQAGFDYEPMQPQVIASSILYALDQPNSVCVSEIVVRPTGQV